MTLTQALNPRRDFFLPALTYKYSPRSLFFLCSAHNHHKSICLRRSSVSMASAVLAESSSAMRTYPAIAFSKAQAGRAAADIFDTSVEHGAVKVVAVNDPFIEPHYAVSSFPAALLSWTRRDPKWSLTLTPCELGIYAQVRLSAWSIQRHHRS